ncbi:hypothetical protein B296_00052090 [Ensete ventricosum]|uniref:Uncharacterized protein n=1 Tax=Ensete ventricosum TaxID=4639 RepID=A0A426X6R5_ENSVE|nr:hypothetical protein B296_00052090 [Ensete ventricosum]
MRLWQREENEEGTAGGNCDSKGGWLQPSIARRGGRMGDGDEIEGWKGSSGKGGGSDCGQRWLRLRGRGWAALDPTVAVAVTLLCRSGLRLQISNGVEEEEAATASEVAVTVAAAAACVGRRRRWDRTGGEGSGCGQRGLRLRLQLFGGRNEGNGSERRKGDGRDGRQRWQGGEEQRWPTEEEATDGEGNDDVKRWWGATGRQMLQ